MLRWGMPRFAIATGNLTAMRLYFSICDEIKQITVGAAFALGASHARRRLFIGRCVNRALLRIRSIIGALGRLAQMHKLARPHKIASHIACQQKSAALAVR
jgi:hypothetical protein